MEEGYLHLKYIALPSGSVDNISVVESTGDPRWVKAASKSIETWKHRKTNRAYRQEFNAKLEE
ncbi:hypothetical protein GL2_03310 [Microbulbifer sp. GL-2]|nr:hypothetical protein GL2_03310 [Microbulbifer sp. GL-2]